MIVPTFVGGGVVWDLFHSWLAILIWVIVVGAFTGWLIGVKMSGAPDGTAMKEGWFLRWTEEGTMEDQEKKRPEDQVEGTKGEENLPFCTTAPSAEQARAENEDEPCDDARGGK
jgi:hypothetical protein